MKFKNTILIIVVSYIVILLVSSILELQVMSKRAKDVQLLLKTAADMSLEQIQLVDDFLGYGDKETLTMKFPATSGNGFIDTDVFEGIYGKSSAEEGNSEAIFDLLYGTSNDMKRLMERTNAIRKPIRYYADPTHPEYGLTWYTIPTSALMGTDILPSGVNAFRVRDSRGQYVSDELSEKIYTDYRLKDYRKTSGTENYYNTPLNIGVTYINTDLLGSVFMTNVDLMMRGDEKDNLNTPEGGNGLIKGSTFADRMTENLQAFNPINNGQFSVLRYNQRVNNANVNAYEGITPQVEYKIIDMYNSSNDAMLELLFGGNKAGYPSKAQYLRELDRDTLNPMTGMPYTTKPIVVAKVSFYMDVVVPYFMLTSRDFRSKFGDDFQMIDVAPSSDDVSNMGARRIVYTRYFAVSP